MIYLAHIQKMNMKVSQWWSDSHCENFVGNCHLLEPIFLYHYSATIINSMNIILNSQSMIGGISQDASTGDHPVQVSMQAPFQYQITPTWLDLPQPRTLWAPSWPPPPRVISFRDDPTGRVNFWVTCHMLILSKLTLAVYAGNRPWFSLMEQSLIWNKVIPAIPHDSAKALITKDINSPLQIGVQCPCLTAIQ